jgi:signal transduction histidine kinase/tetratricopeptide (TPR) repeat protein
VESLAETDRWFGDRYHADHVVCSASGVETWLGTDQLAARAVVIKTAPLAQVPTSVFLRMEHDAELLREAGRAHLAPLLAVGQGRERVFQVAPFIPGHPLAKLLNARRLTVRESLAIVRSVLDALCAVHYRGVLHRDIRPSNVIVPEGEIREGVLIGFGLQRFQQLDFEHPEELLEAAVYRSPEQAGLLEREVDERSDLYSTGLLLFECLTGRHLIIADTVSEVLRGHMTVTVPNLRALGVEAPRLLDDVLRHLLKKDPRERYQTAAAALADLDGIGAALDRGEHEPRWAIGQLDRGRALTEPAFVGRSAELDALESALERAASGAGGLVLVEAESGGGKSRMLDEIADRHAAEAWVLRGGATARAGQPPYQLLLGVVGGVAARLHVEPTLAARLRARLGPHADEVGAVLPDLARGLGVSVGAELGPEAFGEARTLRALSVLLDALGDVDPARPALLLLDDGQWADELSLRLLAEWHRTAGHDRRVLVILALRAEELPPEHLLAPLRQGVRIRLRPLQPDETEHLARSIAGKLPPEAVEAIRRLSDGNPFMASAVLHGMVESSWLVPGRDGWRVDREREEGLQSSLRAAAFLARRLQLLPEAVLRLLSIGAVLGRTFDLDLVVALAGEPPGSAIEALEEARRRHMLWERQRGAAYEFVHDRLREALLDRLDAEERRTLHLKAAEQLEVHQPFSHYDLAYHYERAGVPERALPHALAAATEARARHALEIAEHQYRIAARGAQAADDATRQVVAEGLGDVLTLRGQYGEAAAQFELARGLAPDAVGQAAIEGKLGDLEFKRGQMQKAIRSLERALRLLGRSVPHGRVWLRIWLFWELLVQLAHTLFPRWILHRRSLVGAEPQLLAARLYSRLAYAYWFGRGPLNSAWVHLRELNLVERYPPTRELGQAWSGHAPIMSAIPLFGRAIAYGQRSLALRRKLGDRWGQAQSRNFLGFALYAASRYHDCLEQCTQAATSFEQMGDRWELASARWHMACCHYRLGNLHAAVEIGRNLYREGVEDDNRQFRGSGLEVWVSAAGGRVPRKLLQPELIPTDDLYMRIFVLKAEGIRLLAAKDPTGARAVLLEARGLLKRMELRGEYATTVDAWLASAERADAEAAAPWDPRERRRHLARSRRTARAAVRAARRFRNSLPHALRELALTAALAGRGRRARRAFDESLEVANVLGAHDERARTLAARGDVGAALGWADAGNDRREAHRIRAELDAALGEHLELRGEARPATLSLADRFSAIVTAGSSLAAALTEEAVFQAIREAAASVLRADHSLALWLEGSDPNGPLVAMHGSDDVPWMEGLVRRVIRDGRVRSTCESRSATDGPLPEGVRSAICAPVFLRGTLKGVIYAGHRQIDCLFGETDERLIEFIAKLAGVAMENAAGFAWIQEALQSRDEFLVIASHELRTPLSALLLQVGVLSHRVAEPVERWDAVHITSTVDRIKRSAFRLQRLIQQLLDVTQLTEGRVELQRETVDLSALVKEVAANLIAETLAPGSQLRLELAPRMTGPWDPRRLELVVVNLIGNAVKYGQGRPIRVIVDGDKQIARLQVEDQGMGIDAADLARIFERFQRGVSSRHYGGFGVGLWIVRQIVEAHGGVVAVQSTPGTGTTFSVELPRKLH